MNQAILATIFVGILMSTEVTGKPMFGEGLVNVAIPKRNQWQMSNMWGKRNENYGKSGAIDTGKWQSATYWGKRDGIGEAE